MATVLVLTAVIFGTEVWVERRIAVDSYIEPVGQKKKKVAPDFMTACLAFRKCLCMCLPGALNPVICRAQSKLLDESTVMSDSWL